MKKYENYVSNLNILVKAEKEDLENEFIISGIIDKFMLQFELGWKVMKEFLKYEGSQVANTGSPREIIKAAYLCRLHGGGCVDRNAEKPKQYDTHLRWKCSKTAGR